MGVCRHRCRVGYIGADVAVSADMYVADICGLLYGVVAGTARVAGASRACEERCAQVSESSLRTGADDADKELRVDNHGVPDRATYHGQLAYRHDQGGSRCDMFLADMEYLGE